MTNHHEIIRKAIGGGGGGTNIINITSFIASKTTEDDSAVRKKPENCIWTKLSKLLLDADDLKQYIGVFLCVITLWGAGCFVLGEPMWPGGYIFDMSLVVIIGYMVGHTLERLTTLSPMVGMTLVGAVYRNIGGKCFLDNNAADVLDFHLRRVYPVIILTRGPLGWSWSYIRGNPVAVFCLATLPWMVECLSVAVLSHTLLKYSWYWGLHLGSILSSVSPAVVVPTMMALQARGLGAKHQVAFLVANAGGLDTAVSEGMFGVINSAIFYPSSITYKIVKAVLAIALGVAMGIVWGFVVDFIPGHKDLYAPTVRSFLIFSGGLLMTYACGNVGWGGISGVAVMVCAATAATRWSKRDWPINDNPVFEVYKLLWAIFEPMLFTLSGYYLDLSSLSWYEFGLIVCCILGALAMRLLTAFLVALASNLSLKESILIAVTWIPKAIVEAVLVRVAADSISGSHSTHTKEDQRIAKSHANIIVIAILITSTLGSGLTTYLGPILLSKDSEVNPGEFGCYDSSANSAPERRHSSML